MRKAWKTINEIAGLIMLVIGLIIRTPFYGLGWIWGNISDGFLAGKENAEENS